MNAATKIAASLLAAGAVTLTVVKLAATPLLSPIAKTKPVKLEVPAGEQFCAAAARNIPIGSSCPPPEGG